MRRALKKQVGGVVSVPVPRNNKGIREDIKQRIASGQFNLGIPVLDNEYTKVVLTSEGNIENKVCKVSARKYPLKEVCAQSAKIHKDLLRLRTDLEYDNMTSEQLKTRLQLLHEYNGNMTDDELRQHLKKCERTRHWLIWHDHSSIASSGFMLFLVREVFDPAVHLTSQEYKEKQGGKGVDVQSVIEAPHLYMLGAAGAKDSDQLAFIPTRRECLKELHSTEVQAPDETETVELREKMRFMNGDNPAVEFEDGTQKGGHFGCCGCGGDMRRASEYDYMAHQKYKTLEEKQSLVLKGKFGKSDAIGPFKSLKVEDLRQELKSRRVDAHGNKKELQERLTDLQRGASRVPALLFGSQQQSLDELNLQDYEVLFFEPLHTCLNHIANILTELPLHMTDVDALLLFKEITNLTLKKDKLRATDYRRAILKVSIALSNKNLLKEDEKDILLLFCEMMGIYYENDGKRSPRSVLRLYNISFRHGQAIQRLLTPPKELTLRKLCGIYYHGSVDHAPLLYRLVCLRSICAELFERYFDRIEDITRKTWNKHIEDLVPNAYLHIQAEDAMAVETNSLATLANQEKEISCLAKGLPKPTNSVFSKELMTKRSSLWQAHLSKICDFLKPGAEIWWKWREDGSVEFFDAPGEPDNNAQGPQLHPFRSNNIRKICHSWEECASQPDQLPIYKMRDEDGKLIYHRESEDAVEHETEPENPLLMQDAAAPLYPEQGENTSSDETTQIIFEDQQADLEIADHNPITINMDLDADEQPDTESPGDLEVNTADNSSIHQTVSSENDCPTEPPSKARKKETSPKRRKEVQSKTAKALALILGKTPEVSEIDRLKQTVAKNPKAHFYRKKYDTLLSNMQTCVLRELRSVKTQLKQWDEDFLSTHSRIPNNSDYINDDHFKELSQKKKVALKLLESWKITVHLL